MAQREAERRERQERATELRAQWLKVLAELREARDDIVLVRALIRDDPDERSPDTKRLLNEIGDPYLREQVAEQQLDEIEAADRERREGRRGAA